MLLPLLTIFLATTSALDFRSKNFDIETAGYLSLLNAISYCPEERIRAWDCGTCNKSLSIPPIVTRVPIDSFLSYVTSDNKDTIFVVFKGTDPILLSQWVADTSLRPQSVSACLGCKVHGGFWNAMNLQRQKVDDTVKGLLNSMPNARVVVTGHSLGGAIAALYAMHLVETLGITPTLYTFGAPRVGNQEWANYFKANFKGPSFHVVTDGDPVPYLPLRRWGFSHSGTVVSCRADSLNCDVLRAEEENVSLKWINPLNHGRYLGVQYLSYVSLGHQHACDSGFKSIFWGLVKRYRAIKEKVFDIHESAMYGFNLLASRLYEQILDWFDDRPALREELLHESL